MTIVHLIHRLWIKSMIKIDKILDENETYTNVTNIRNYYCCM